jgi:hypothetical protein
VGGTKTGREDGEDGGGGSVGGERSLGETEEGLGERHGVSEFGGSEWGGG